MWLRRPDPGEPDEAAERPLTPAETAWPFNADSPVIEGFTRSDRLLRVLIVDVTGLDWDAIEPRLDMIRQVAREKQMVPVVVVDLVDYAGLRGSGLAYDCLPNATANATLAADLDWTAYIARRRQLLREKWRPAAIVNLGDGPSWDEA